MPHRLLIVDDNAALRTDMIRILKASDPLMEILEAQDGIAALKLLNYHVIAGGDSFNDTAMLAEAHVGILFRAPDAVKQQFPQFQAVESYADLMRLIKAAMAA